MNNNVSLIALEKIVIEYTNHIRRAEEGFAGEKLTSFIDNLTNYSTQNKLAENETITNIINVMSLAQQRNDMLFVADIMQYELIPYLQQLAQQEVPHE